MKGLLFSTFIILVEICLAQTTDSVFYFSGYVLDEDSIPIENACLINYRTLRAFSVDEKGYFNIKVQKGDSLKINHLSYKQLIVKANPLSSFNNFFFLPFEPYVIKTVEVKYRNMEMEYFNRNMALIFEQMKINPPIRYQRGAVVNSYAPGAQDPGFGINLSDIISLFKKVRK